MMAKINVRRRKDEIKVSYRKVKNGPYSANRPFVFGKDVIRVPEGQPVEAFDVKNYAKKKKDKELSND
jgi:hypothetical protein